MTYFFEDNNFLSNESDSASFELLGITQSEFEQSIKDHSVGSVDIIEIDDNFGVHFTAKVTLNTNTEASEYVLTTDRHQVLYYESIDNLINALHESGYDPQANLSVHTIFSGF